MYTKRHHAQNLLKFLSKKDFKYCSNCQEDLSKPIDICNICSTFI